MAKNARFYGKATLRNPMKWWHAVAGLQVAILLGSLIFAFLEASLPLIIFGAEHPGLRFQDNQIRVADKAERGFVSNGCGREGFQLTLLFRLGFSWNGNGALREKKR